MFYSDNNIQNLLGECPLWCWRTSRLFWVDIVRSELHAKHFHSGSTRRWSLPEQLGSFAMTSDDNVLLLGMESRLAYFDLSTEKLSEIAASPGQERTRINDGRCDRYGNFIFSTMHQGQPPEAVGAFFRLNAETLSIERLPLAEVAIPNSICFSPDGGTMYYSDSLQGKIMRCDYPSFENQRIFTHVEGGGAPDGSCVDADGYVWNAEWGGSRVVRYRPDGTVDRKLSSPAIQMTCPVIGGAELDTLFCTTARVGLESPHDSDGSLHISQDAVNQGLREAIFAGRLTI
jgi:L-arabinonolactonase